MTDDNPSIDTVWEHYKKQVSPLKKRTTDVSDAMSVSGAALSKKSSLRPGSSPYSTGLSQHRLTAEEMLSAAIDRPVSRNHVLETRLKKPRNKPAQTLDLHGYRRHEAHAVLIAFVRRSVINQDTYIIVVTGKSIAKKLTGQHTETLSYAFIEWLHAAPLNNLVTGYGHAAPRDGGTGAFYLRLKRQPRV